MGEATVLKDPSQARRCRAWAAKAMEFGRVLTIGAVAGLGACTSTGVLGNGGNSSRSSSVPLSSVERPAPAETVPSSTAAPTEDTSPPTDGNGVSSGVAVETTGGSSIITAVEETPDTTAPTTVATVPANDCATVLSQGCKGKDVTRLQRLLNSKGFAKTKVDGDFGPRTLAGLKAYESHCKKVCERDGRITIDGKEWRNLDSLATVTPIEPSA